MSPVFTSRGEKKDQPGGRDVLLSQLRRSSGLELITLNASISG